LKLFTAQIIDEGRQVTLVEPSEIKLVLLSGRVMSHSATQAQLEGKYSLESTGPRESEIRAHLRP